MIIGDKPTYRAQAEFVLNMFPSLKARNIPLKVYKKFDVEFREHGSIFFPHHDTFGNIRGYIERTHSGEPKYMFNPSGVQPLPFNIFRRHEQVDNFVPIFESPFDVMACPYYSVALIGLQTSKLGMRLLRNLCQFFVIAFDSDTSGQGASYRLAAELIKYGSSACVINSGAESMWTEKARQLLNDRAVEITKSGLYTLSISD